MTNLVLFCGGPAIYPGGVPKPLQVVRGKETLLELYLETPFASSYAAVTLLTESDYLAEYGVVAERVSTHVDIRLVETANGSNTLGKLTTYLDHHPVEDHPVVWSYPDVFYFQDLQVPGEVDWSTQALISLRAMASRFPQIVMDPYSLQVRSISIHRSVVPPNPVHLFGGHLIARPELIAQAIRESTTQESLSITSLEFDVFSWMISKGSIGAVVLDAPWLKADSARDLEEIEKVLHIQRTSIAAAAASPEAD